MWVRCWWCPQHKPVLSPECRPVRRTALFFAFSGGDSPFAGRVGTKNCSSPTLWGFQPHAPGHFLLVQKVTKNTLRERGISISPFPENPIPLKRLFKGAAGPLARGATPPSALGAGCTTRSGVMVLYRHCDDHTVVCSRQTQFDSRPRGEWLFVVECITCLSLWERWRRSRRRGRIGYKALSVTCGDSSPKGRAKAAIVLWTPA